VTWNQHTLLKQASNSITVWLSSLEMIHFEGSSSQPIAHVSHARARLMEVDAAAKEELAMRADDEDAVEY